METWIDAHDVLFDFSSGAGEAVGGGWMYT